MVSNVQALHADLSGLKIKPLTFFENKSILYVVRIKAKSQGQQNPHVLSPLQSD